MPTAEQIERSRERNRKRHGEAGMSEILQNALAPRSAEDRQRHARERDAGPRFAPKYGEGGYQIGMHDAWGAPEPPAA